MTRSKRIGSWVAALFAVGILAAAGAARGQTAPQTLVYAVYNDPATAKDVFNSMKQSQKEGVIHIDSFAVVSKDSKGKVHVDSLQKRSAIAGSVIGALVGVVGGPAGMAAGAAAGGGMGFLTGEAVGIPREDINAIKASLTPGSSAIIAVVDERWVADLERSLHEANAKEVLDHKIAGTAGQQGTSPNQPEQQQQQQQQNQPSPKSNQ